MLFLPYPQYEFGSEIKSFLKNHNRNSSINLIDAPCGNGEVSYMLSEINGVNIEAADISPTCIQHAKKWYQRKNIKFDINDIHHIFEKKNNIHVVCVINSFFLLERRDQLLANIYKSLNNNGIFILIFPNIHGNNYKNFKRLHGSVNQVELELAEMKGILTSARFRNIHHKELCYANIYGRVELKYISRLAPIYLRILSKIMKLLKIGNPSYFLLTCSKYEA